ncbi:MAG: DUF1838 family protein [Steroidobacteraceae bacterium]|nr:DUF1838 family protein [Nevskiaceae bacterium]
MATTTTDRRSLLFAFGSAAASATAAAATAGPSATSVMAQAATGSAAATTASANAATRPLALDDAALMRSFMKLRGATDGRLTIGWMDAANHAFVDGATWPMYRLLAATFQTFRQASDTLWESRTLEIAHFLDMQSGALLEKLTMPLTGTVVDVPAYRAGPTDGKVALRLDETREFRMPGESPAGASFFQTGQAITQQLVSQPQLEGERFRVREELGARIVPAQPGQRGFFYREWTIWRGDWQAVQDPAVHCVATEVVYSAATAWRPWMKMGNAPGNTLQNGLGGKVERVEDLPPELLRLTRQIHPDLVRDPVDVLAGGKT